MSRVHGRVTELGTNPCYSQWQRQTFAGYDRRLQLLLNSGDYWSRSQETLEPVTDVWVVISQLWTPATVPEAACCVDPGNLYWNFACSRWNSLAKNKWNNSFPFALSPVKSSETADKAGLCGFQKFSHFNPFGMVTGVWDTKKEFIILTSVIPQPFN